MAKYSAQALRLLEVVSGAGFRRIEDGFRKQFSGGIEVVSLDGNAVRKFCSGDCHPEICKLIRGSRCGRGRCREERKRSIDMALRTGMPYISICHAGIVLGCVPVIDGDEAIGGVFFGKWIWDGFDEKVHLETMRRLSGLRIREDLVWFAGKKLNVVSARKTYEAAEYLYVLVYEVTGFLPQVSCRQREPANGDFQKDEEIVKVRKSFWEKRFVCRSKLGDIAGAREIFEEAVGKICSGNKDLNEIKSQLAEVILRVGRRVVEAGVDVDPMLGRYLEYIGKMKGLDTLEGVFEWIKGVLGDFSEFVYEGRDAEKMERLRPAVEFVHLFFAQDVSLGNIARAAGISVSRLCHLFKEQTGLTVVEYLTDVRMENAKKLLLRTEKSVSEVCREVGYKNQSYFSKVFKELFSVAPSEFRKK